VLLAAGAALLLVVGITLGSVAVIALLRSEGVFLPTGYVALICLTAGVLLARLVLQG
jgi:hypothetical protein